LCFFLLLYCFRLALPADALEEFLSILRSSGPISVSPTIRSHRHAPSTLPSFIYERTHPYVNSYTKRSSITSVTSDGPDLDLHAPVIALPSASIQFTPKDDSDLDDLTSMRTSPFGILGINSLDYCISAVLFLPYSSITTPESPISRSHTRNPFHRHPSYEKAYVNIFPQVPTIQSPASSSIPTCVSPASIPLPADSDDRDIL